MREYHALSELRHPRIIEVYDYGVDAGVPYYTMELLDGEDLAKVSPLPYRDACRYLRDVASSLALLHARRLLHRDVSPRNGRRTSDGRCKLLDFGAMVPFGTPPNVTGTPPCIAPEALQGAPLDQRTDLYSLGALAYLISTGRNAFPVGEIAALPAAWTQAPVNRRRIARDIPEALDTLVMSLLSLDPMKRPASTAEVIDLLSAAGQLAPGDTAAVARSFLAGSQLVNRDVERAKLSLACPRTTPASPAQWSYWMASKRNATACSHCAPKTPASASQYCATPQAGSPSYRAHCSTRSAESFTQPRLSERTRFSRVERERKRQHRARACCAEHARGFAERPAGVAAHID
ncbi:MAG TPA: serine/threonine-protein kinase [Polyangiales bacterium]|nr:serine/threonine-protein kinase [Polyangiales bacterium]